MRIGDEFEMSNDARDLHSEMDLDDGPPCLSIFYGGLAIFVLVLWVPKAIISKLWYRIRGNGTGKTLQ